MTLTSHSLLPNFVQPISLAVMGISFALVFILILFFMGVRDNPHMRSRILIPTLFLTFFGWTYTASTLVYFLSHTYLQAVRPDLLAVQTFAIVFASLYLSTIPVTTLIQRIVPRLLFKRMQQRYNLSKADPELCWKVHRIATGMRLGDARVYVADLDWPLSFTMAGGKKRIIVSKRLLGLLDEDELQAVIAHELAHLKHRTSTIKALAAAYRTIIRFDPLTRFIEAAFHRESELLADQTSARITGKPLALASALLKIHDAFDSEAGNQNFLSTGMLSHMYPTMKNRIERLLRMADRYLLSEKIG
ncbi:MAG: M48 family metalloprotease [Candidatus Bathyarchaeia archaeon]